MSLRDDDEEEFALVPLIRDVAGGLYHLADPAALDKRSRALPWAFVD